jgi:predicted deacylase
VKDRDTLILESLYESIGERPIVITGGMHGDEVAGNIAADRFKNKKGIYVISHINSTDKRREGPIDLNRHFEEDDSVEKEDEILNKIVSLKPRVVISMHEDCDGSGIYAYCNPEFKEQLKGILDGLDAPKAKSACGDDTEDGVISFGHLPTKGTLERALRKKGIPYCTLETPMDWEENERADYLENIANQIISLYNSSK